MKTYTTSGTGGGQTLSEIETDKIPVYNSKEDIEADLANLTVGQIVATADTGDELSQPVDVVEKGNLHAVSSNAVAESLSYSETERFTGKYFGNKKVYRCAVNVLTSQLATIQNIQHLLEVTGYIENNGNKLMANTYRSETTFSFIYLNGNTIYAQFPQGWANSNCYINLEYTKTTD